jgi:outer membrane protein assembly factor BamE (lipoprotein component of BamABCDE complex)
MFDVMCDGNLIARAENVEQETIYILNYKGMGNEDIAYLLGIPLKSVTRFTEGGAIR